MKAEVARRYRLGLVVGKFAPLHLGHEWLVQQAAAQCERLLVLSYTKPEFERCEIGRRRQWLATRFPQHECLVIDDAWLTEVCKRRHITVRPMPTNCAEDAVQQHWLAWLLRDVLQRQPDALFCSEAYGPPCAATLSQVFGRAVEAVVVDPARVHVPISATIIRQSPVSMRHWMAAEVGGAFVRRLVLLGGESSGKTTLAQALAERLGTRWVSEYGRELWEQQGGLSEADLLRVAREQVLREDAAACAVASSRSACNWLVCDTSPLTTLGYSGWMFGRSDPELVALAARSYDAAVLCAPDFPFVQDGTRQDAGFRVQQHAWYTERLEQGTTPWLAVGGSLSQRTTAVCEWLERG
ncbi:AAA family ATPase [Ideonella sp.]|uniref:AAA family ATPase n=1 Tax=Ideonella sp. TaxID=1929293 RepID=UPI003BB69FC2